MKTFGFLSFGHYGGGRGSQTHTAQDALKQAIELAEGADQLGVNGAYFRVHHFAKQQAAPFPLLSAIAARTRNIEVGTGVIDMRYENPLYLAEEAAALDLISDGRMALGISRGAPETAIRGYEAFGYTGSQDERGADLAREKFALFLDAVDGKKLAPSNPQMTGVNTMLRVEPHSPGLRKRLWWGSGTRETAKWVGELGLNMMSSTLLTEEAGVPFHELQYEQIQQFRQSYAAAGHDGVPRVSVSRSIFPLMNDTDMLYFGRNDGDQVGYIDGFLSTFGKTYAAEPDQLVKQLKQDSAVMDADTLMLTLPTQLGVDYNLHVLESIAKYVAPELGWEPSR